jgi:hypothetical protein
VSSYQDGSWAAARIGQYGNANVAVVNQVGTGFMMEDRTRAGIQQRGEDAYANVYQFGAGDLTVVNQWGGANDATTSQVGNWNTAILGQTSPAGIAWADRNIMAVSQTGNGHYANVWQNGVRNVGSITQY